MYKFHLSLADLLTVLGTIVFGLFCFLSFNFLSLGETLTSFIKAAGLASLIGGLAFFAKSFKKTSSNFKTCIIWEGTLLLLFTCTAIYALFPFSHYFSMLAKKPEIQNKVTTNIAQAEGMFNDYEDYANNRENIYNRRLKNVVAAKKLMPGEYRSYGFVDETSDSKQVENKMFTLHAQLFPSNYEGNNGMKQVAANWLANAKNTLESKWAFTLGIVDVINNVQTNTTTWKNELEKFSTFRAQGETAKNFDYPLTFKNVTDEFTKPSRPNATSILIAIALYVLLLWSYFVSGRHSRYPGLKVIFGTRSVKENEL